MLFIWIYVSARQKRSAEEKDEQEWIWKHAEG